MYLLIVERSLYTLGTFHRRNVQDKIKYQENKKERLHIFVHAITYIHS